MKYGILRRDRTLSGAMLQLNTLRSNRKILSHCSILQGSIFVAIIHDAYKIDPYLCMRTLLHVIIIAHAHATHGVASSSGKDRMNYIILSVDEAEEENIKMLHMCCQSDYYTIHRPTLTEHNGG